MNLLEQSTPVTRQATDVKEGETEAVLPWTVNMYLIAMSLVMLVSIVVAFCIHEWKVTLVFVAFCTVLVFTPLVLSVLL